jgi:hypothetical protein
LTSACGGHELDLGHNADPTTDSVGSDAGVGVPTVVIGHQHRALAIALDDTRVYWSTETAHPEIDDPVEGGTVRSCAKENCAATLITYATSQNAFKIVVNKSRVYWSDTADQIFACPIEGCAGSPIRIPGDQSSFVVDDSHIYLMSNFSGELQRVSLEDRTTTKLAEHLNSSEAAQGGTLVVDSSYVYWIVPGPLGKVMRVRKDGSESAEAVITGLHQPNSLAVGPTGIFWTEHSTFGAVMSCPLNGCVGDPVVIASEQSYPYGLASGGDRIYWLLSLDGWQWPSEKHPRGNLLACASAGCGSSPELLTTEVYLPQAVAADATHVYWTSAGPGNAGDGVVTYTEGAVKRIRWPAR